MKRTLAVRSETNLYAEAAGEFKRASLPYAGGEPSGSKYLIVGYPVGESHTEKIGEFLQQCNYSNCRKPIASNANVFMYGDFGAFCSVECRGFQINLDKKARKLAKASKSRSEKIRAI